MATYTAEGRLRSPAYQGALTLNRLATAHGSTTIAEERMPERIRPRAAA